MKNIVTILLIVAVILSMAACGGTANSVSSVETATPASFGDETEIPAESAAGETTAEPVETAVEVEPVADAAESTEEPAPESTAVEEPAEPGSNILVAYFSRVGNTEWAEGVDVVTSASLNLESGEYVGNAEYLANMAQAVTGGDLFLIQTVETYPSDYRETTDVAAEEQDENARPALSSHVENMDQYDTIVLIYPNWWGTLPQPLFTFLEEYDFSGKTILPLCTHEGSGLGRSESAIAELCPNAALLEGLAVRGSNAASAQSEVEEWIKNSGILDS